MSWNNNNTSAEHQACIRVDIFPIFVCAFFLNVFALIAVSKAKPRETFFNTGSKQIHTLILCLSVSDTVVVALECIMPITSFINCGWWGGQTTCDLFGYISAILVVWSAWIVVLLSFQRFFVTAYPFKYRYHFTKAKIRRLLIAAFLAQGVFFIAPFLGVGEFVYYETGQFCSLSLTPTGVPDTVFLSALVAQGLTCVILTVFFNIYVVVSLKTRKSVFHGRTRCAFKNATSNFVTLTKAVALVFCLCYIPFLIRIAVDLFKQTNYEELGLQHTITMALMFANTLANPFIYVACRKRYCRSLQKLCFGCCVSTSVNRVVPDNSVFVLYKCTIRTSRQSKNGRRI